MSVRPLSKELQEKAIRELNEVPGRIPEDIQNVKEWILKQPHLQGIKADDRWILSYLRGSKFSLQTAKQKLNVCYTMRAISEEFFKNRDPFQPEIQEFFNRSIFVILPRTSDTLAPTRFLMAFGNADPEKISITTIIKSIIMTIDMLALEDDACVINGQEVFVDFQNFRYNYASQLNPYVLKCIVVFLQNAYATRFKGLYLINIPGFLYPIIKIFKSFLSEEIKKRLHIYSENNQLYSIIPTASLPKEYGGEGGSIRKMSDDLRTRIGNYADWFKEESKYCSQETKRQQIQKFALDICNMEGSFRKLDID